MSVLVGGGPPKPTPHLGVSPSPWSPGPKGSKQATRDGQRGLVPTGMLKVRPCDIASSPFQHPTCGLPARTCPDHPALKFKLAKRSRTIQLRLELRVGGNPSMPLGLVSGEAAKDGDPVGGHAISGSLERQRLC